MLSYEITYGIKKRWLIICIAFIPIIFLFINQYILYKSGLTLGAAFPNTISYHLGKILYGIKIMNGGSIERNRQLPTQWMLIQFSYLLTISGFVHEERQNRQANIILYGTYRRWWWRKICWFYTLSIGYYLLIGLFELMEHRLELMINIPNNVEIINSQFGNFEPKIYVYTIIFFILHSLLFGMLQMCMELKIQSTVAFIINIGIMLSGIFSTKFILPCHLAMIAKNSSILQNTSLTIGLIILGILLLISEQITGRQLSKNGF